MNWVKTKAIVLQTIKYNDSSIIAQLYTAGFGRLSVMVGGLKSKRGRSKALYFTPLSILNIEIDYKEKRQIQRPKDFNFDVIFSELPYNTHKTTMAIFIAEVLQKSLHEQEPNPMLFSFLATSIQYLDHIKNGLANFHLSFLVQLSRYLGVFPVNNYSEKQPYFDLQKGKFKSYDAISPFLLTIPQSKIIFRLLRLNYSELEQLKISREARYQILEAWLRYLAIHIEGFGEIKSLKVLKEIFEN